MKYLLILPATLLATAAFGQHLEYSARGSATAANFRGDDAASTSFVQYGATPASGGRYTQNPYGKGTGIGFGAGVRVQRVGKTGLLAAFDLGYDLLHTQTDITRLNDNSTVSSTSQSASGTTHLYTQYLTGFAGVGYRLQGEKYALDGLVGPELAYVLRSLDYGSGTRANTIGWSTNLNRPPAHNLDFRLRADITLWRSRVGLAASYSYGFTNYYPGTSTVPNPQAYANALRLGLAYRLK